MAMDLFEIHQRIVDFRGRKIQCVWIEKSNTIAFRTDQFFDGNIPKFGELVEIFEVGSGTIVTSAISAGTVLSRVDLKCPV